jgi:hypothetical protein
MSCFLFYVFPFFFYKMGEQEEGISLPMGEGWHQWEWGGNGERGKEGEYGAKNVCTCM